MLKSSIIFILCSQIIYISSSIISEDKKQSLIIQDNNDNISTFVSSIELPTSTIKAQQEKETQPTILEQKSDFITTSPNSNIKEQDVLKSTDRNEDMYQQTTTDANIKTTEKILLHTNGSISKIGGKNSSQDINDTPLMKLCTDIFHNNETCFNLYDLMKNEKYLQLTWEITCKMFFERPFGVVIFIFWTVFLSLWNLLILFLCTLLKPLRAILLNKIISDLRRRYYFTNDSSELRVIDNNKK